MGSVSLCMQCGAVSIYDLTAAGVVELREPTFEELQSVGPQVAPGVRAVLHVNARKPRPSFRRHGC
jgi:hypothetical protein